MRALFWVLLIAAVVLGVIGVLAAAMLWLLYVGIAVFLFDIATAAMRSTGRRRRLLQGRRSLR